MKTQLWGLGTRLTQESSVNSMHYVGARYLDGVRHCARADFKEKRINGDEKTDAQRPWDGATLPEEKDITWTKGERRYDGYVYGVKKHGAYHYECRYDANTDDLEWMRQTDCNYLKRLLREGNLQTQEPDVWRLRKMDLAEERDIGDWWSEKLKLSNIGDLLSNSEEAYQRFKESEEKARVAREQKQKQQAERERIEQAEKRRKEKEEQERREKEREERTRKAKAEELRKQQEGYKRRGLIHCIKEKDIDGVRYLLTTEDIDVNGVDDEEKNALQHAILGNQGEIIKLLLARAEMNINHQCLAERTALHYAVFQEDMETVKALVAKGVEIVTEDSLGQSALDIAKERRNAVITGFLKREEANRVEIPPRLSLPSTPASPSTPIHKGSNSSQSRITESGSMSISIAISDNRLTLGKKIGEGAFGVVYQGEWNQTTVAIKQLHIKNLTEKSLSDFKRESEIMAYLRHPNIVQFYGACFEPGHYSMVMELMPQGSLFNVLQNNQVLPWNIRFNIAMDITNGLAHLHSKDIIHRDLKSLNVLLDNNMRAKLTDFGLSKVKTETRSTTTVNNKSVGTLAWMAPETFGIRPKYSKKSDIYSYGMILWEIATRELPFAEAEAEEVRSAIKQGETEEVPEEIKEAYPHYAALITACWIFKPENRPTIEEAYEKLKLNPIVEEVEKMEKTYEQKAQLKTGPEYDDNFATNRHC